MSEFSDIHAIAEKNKIAVDGRVSVTTEEWNTVLTHIEKITRENILLKGDRQNDKNEKLKKENADIRAFLESLLVDVNEEINRQQSLNK